MIKCHFKRKACHVYRVGYGRSRVGVGVGYGKGGVWGRVGLGMVGLG